MARGRAKGYDEQRESILARAGELFAAQGYHAASMNQVAEACGLSKATLYHYYRDKDALLVSIADGVNDGVIHRPRDRRPLKQPYGLAIGRAMSRNFGIGYRITFPAP
jgi:AcrR family transcriptional regulator